MLERRHVHDGRLLRDADLRLVRVRVLVVLRVVRDDHDVVRFQARVRRRHGVKRLDRVAGARGRREDERLG